LLYDFKISVPRQYKNSGDKDDMLHPDKANGQQAHERTRIPVILRALLLGLFLGIAGLPNPAPAETAVLKEVRMGNHDGYIRVVFEFSAAVQYQVSENTATGNASIRFLDTTSELSATPITNPLDCIDTVSTFQDGNHIVANLLFDPKVAELNPFTLQRPDRMVLDVFCRKEPVIADSRSESREIVPEPQDATPEPRDIATTPIRAEENILLVNPELTRPSSDKAQLPIDQTRIPKEIPKKKDNSQQYLLLLLAAITGIIVLLIALIIFQKKSLSENHVAGNPDTTGETDNMMHAIDTKIKEKLMKYDK
jgi:hypothetical protein